MQLILDASVCIKWFVPEEFSTAALAYRKTDNHIWAPDLLIAECCNILWKKTRSKEISHDEASQIQAWILDLNIHFLSSNHLAELALELALQLNIAAYDAIYLAAALVVDCKLVTADGKLFKKISTGQLKKNIEWVGGLL